MAGFGFGDRVEDRGVVNEGTGEKGDGRTIATLDHRRR